MCQMCQHTIHAAQHHFGWDNSLEPALTIASGDAVEVFCVDSSGAQLSPVSTVEDVATLDFGAVNPVTGPIYIDGAEPGDVIKITVDAMTPHDYDGKAFGWTAIIPGFGLLADQFTNPDLTVWSFDKSIKTPALFGDQAAIPLKPFIGTIGLAPGEPGQHSVVPPRRVGGNLDIKDIAVGTELYLPVEVAGGLFSVGDTHAAQGDGEVCGTAIESPFDLALTFDLIKDAPIKMPRFTTPGPVSNHLDAKGYEVTTGVGPDLMTAARDAVAGMIDFLGATRGMSAEQAYMLVSTCGDLRISEIVDMPNVVVSFYLPRIIFE